MVDERVKAGAKTTLTELYESLNPASLKRTVNRKLHKLYQAHQRKMGHDTVEAAPAVSNVSVSNHLIERYCFGVMVW